MLDIRRAKDGMRAGKLDTCANFPLFDVGMWELAHFRVMLHRTLLHYSTSRYFAYVTPLDIHSNFYVILYPYKEYERRHVVANCIKFAIVSNGHRSGRAVGSLPRPFPRY